MKGVYKFLGVSEIGGWFPAVVSGMVPFPFDQVLVLVLVLTTVKNLFNFILKFVFDLDWIWWWGDVAINVVALPRGEAVDMKNRVLMH